MALNLSLARAEGSRERTAPDWFTHRAQATETADERVIESHLKATPERAMQDANDNLRRAVGDWLALAGVPRSWTPKKALVSGMVLESYTEPQTRQDVKVYLTALRADFSPQRREIFLQEHSRQVVGARMGVLAAGLFFVLIALGCVTSYIRADEATKGYYTNRLRLAAIGGVAAAGWALYRLVA
jgi:hypothetical protein